jgi:transposase
MTPSACEATINAGAALANIPNRREKRFRWTKALYRERNQVERFFNKLKQFRRIATRYDKLGAPYLASPIMPLILQREK